MARRYRPFLVAKNDECLALELSFYFFCYSFLNTLYLQSFLTKQRGSFPKLVRNKQLHVYFWRGSSAG